MTGQIVKSKIDWSNCKNGHCTNRSFFRFCEESKIIILCSNPKLKFFSRRIFLKK